MGLTGQGWPFPTFVPLVSNTRSGRPLFPVGR